MAKTRDTQPIVLTGAKEIPPLPEYAPKDQHPLINSDFFSLAEKTLFTKQCLDRRIPDMATLQQEAKAWYRKRNANQKAVDWQFTSDDARVKLKKLYPQIQML
jgi:hypothetical protein